MLAYKKFAPKEQHLLQQPNTFTQINPPANLLQEVTEFNSQVNAERYEYDNATNMLQIYICSMKNFEVKNGILYEKIPQKKVLDVDLRISVTDLKKRIHDIFHEGKYIYNMQLSVLTAYTQKDKRISPAWKN
jgi:hypothetical protein